MKKIMLLLAEGFEEVEALTTADYLRRKNIVVDMVSITNNNQVKGAHGIIVIADKNMEEIDDINAYDGLIIPGGLPGATNLRDNDSVIKIVKDFNKEGKLIGAICAGPIVLQRAGIINGIKVTSYPGFDEELKDGLYEEELVVQDRNIITARGPAVAVYFAIRILEHLIGKDKAEELKKDILLDLVENK
jgi:4-methyl-5(b-hydroxyethyl)-thiazole monophosphate biosynthesis